MEYADIMNKGAEIVAYLTGLDGKITGAEQLAYRFKVKTSSMRAILNQLGAELKIRPVKVGKAWCFYVPTVKMLEAEARANQRPVSTVLRIDPHRTLLYVNIKQEREKYASIG